MKYVQCQDLSQFNWLLDGYDCGTFIIYGKLEGYSCAKTQIDKKVAEEVEKSINVKKEQQQQTNPIPIKASFEEDEYGNIVPVGNDYTRSRDIRSPLFPALSPPCPHDLTVRENPFGDSKADTQKFIDLIALLNLSYPDYDFSGLKMEDFSREIYKQRLISSINLSLRDAFNAEQLNQMWKVIDRIVSIYDSEIYSYHPDRNQDDPTGDPLALTNGKIWTWNYFFYNKKLKRVLFFTCCARNKSMYFRSDAMSDEDSDYDTLSNPKNMDVHMFPRKYDSNDDDEDMYFDDM